MGNANSLANLREVDDDLDDERYDNMQKDMIDDLNSQQIKVKSYELNTK